MSEIVLSPQQSAIVASARGHVRVLNEEGDELGTLIGRESDESPLSMTVEQVIELARRCAAPTESLPTTREVLQRIKQRTQP